MAVVSEAFSYWGKERKTGRLGLQAAGLAVVRFAIANLIQAVLSGARACAAAKCMGEQHGQGMGYCLVTDQTCRGYPE